MITVDVDPFVEATRKTLSGILGTPVSSAEASQTTSLETGYDVSGIVGLSNLNGTAREDGWSVVLSFSEDVARRIVAKVLGISDIPSVDEDVADGIGELVNVVVGAAKRRLEAQGHDRCVVSLPTVILGSQHRVFRLRKVPCCVVPFTSPAGEFLLQVSYSSDMTDTAVPRL